MALKLSNKKIISATRKKQTRFKILLSVLCVVVVSVAIYGTYSHALDIRQVEVVGAEHTDMQKVKDIVLDETQKRAWFIFPQRNRIFFPENKVAIRIHTEVPSVETVDVDGHMMGDVVVTIKDRRPAGIWCNSTVENDCYFFDTAGVIFKPSFAFTGSVYTRWRAEGVTLSLGQPVPCLPGCIEDAYVQFLADHKITDAVLGQAGMAVLQSMDGYSIKASGDTKVTMKHLATLRDRKVDLKTVEYVDARLENKIFYK